jgi:hypothetical protein
MRVEAGQGPAEPQSARNEVDEFHDHRALGAAEACWRLYSNDMSGRSPAVLALTVHLENGLRVYFTDETAGAVAEAEPAQTHLTAWFALNAQTPENDPAPPAYHDMPGLYSWKGKTLGWVLKKRGNNGTVGRLHWIHPSAGDVFYLRILLCHPH